MHNASGEKVQLARNIKGMTKIKNEIWNRDIICSRQSGNYIFSLEIGAEAWGNSKRQLQVGKTKKNANYICMKFYLKLRFSETFESKLSTLHSFQR